MRKSWYRMVSCPVYLEGDVIPYGRDVKVSPKLCKSRALEKGLLMDVKDIPVSATRPSARMASFLAYLRDYRRVDISSNYEVAEALCQLCVEFKQEYQTVFGDGFQPLTYRGDLDRYTLLNNLMNVEYWAFNVRAIRN